MFQGAAPNEDIGRWMRSVQTEVFVADTIDQVFGNVPPPIPSRVSSPPRRLFPHRPTLWAVIFLCSLTSELSRQHRHTVPCLLRAFPNGRFPPSPQHSPPSPTPPHRGCVRLPLLRPLAGPLPLLQIRMAKDAGAVSESGRNAQKDCRNGTGDSFSWATHPTVEGSGPDNLVPFRTHRNGGE